MIANSTKIIYQQYLADTKQDENLKALQGEKKEKERTG